MTATPSRTGLEVIDTVDDVGCGEGRERIDAVVIVVEIDRVELPDGFLSNSPLDRPDNGIDVVGIESEHVLVPSSVIAGRR